MSVPQRLKNERDIFLTAVMFFTRIPVPHSIGHGQDMLQKSARYFPWVGLLVGAINALSFYFFQLVFPMHLSILFMMIVSILTTGAFHEDGFADVCDAFGGGWTKEKILIIMKDSRLGTYGVIGLIAILSSKFFIMEMLATRQSLPVFLFIIVAAHSSSRLAAVTLLQQYDYVTDADQSKSKPVADRKLNAVELCIAFAGGLLPFLFLPAVDLLPLLLVIIARVLLGKYFYKWIGGQTGDCAGATQQVCEIAFYIGIVLLWKFI
ncbi:adenosylcobinamide-GDP ribazoletransferase [Pinibacter aurantiacus]|uniref:Adenosylcobinamide-GDP ribazoletransferase n=1 Tax=Pinibacter aurantiacus TaxID=2851599 RepID=A0A9E2W8A7_9BACT|nr:adenosylcobinamide-GDP ribazoletransferase [Pinibacter aurantiacus]MBV4358231.1 adenosylcobinamide-GDP ribazoletransferase [Pinibacter aurantiacus]